MLSIILPTLNEAETLSRVVRHTIAAARGAAVELIVSDCASRDQTVAIAQRLGARIATERALYRADAMNRGAAVARGGVLLFLHADTFLPDGFARRVVHVLKAPDIVGGAFDFAWGPELPTDPMMRLGLRLVKDLNRARFRLTRNFYGDQAIFVRRPVFQRLGGFPRVRLMEDLRFSRRLAGCGRTAILSPPVLTSPRRFLVRGVLRQFLHDFLLSTCDNVCLRPEFLWQHYNHLNHAAHALDESEVHGSPRHPVHLSAFLNH